MFGDTRVERANSKQYVLSGLGGDVWGLIVR